MSGQKCLIDRIVLGDAMNEVCIEKLKMIDF